MQRVWKGGVVRGKSMFTGSSKREHDIFRKWRGRERREEVDLEG